MSQKYDSLDVIARNYGKISADAKTELWETYGRIQDLSVAGSTIGDNGGPGKFGGMLMNIARMLGSSPFIPTMGSEAINIPGSSYYTPISGGTGMVPGGQAAFGLAPFSQVAGFKTGASGGGAAPLKDPAAPINQFSEAGVESAASQSFGFSGGFRGDNPSDPEEDSLWGDAATGGLSLDGIIAGGASPAGNTGIAAGTAQGVAAGLGIGQNVVMPLASIVGGIGGLLTTFGPYFGPIGMAAAAGGAVANGLSGAVLSSFQHVSGRILNNTDTILAAKVKNLESVAQMMGAQETIIRKMIKDSFDSDKKSLDNIS